MFNHRWHYRMGTSCSAGSSFDQAQQSLRNGDYDLPFIVNERPLEKPTRSGVERTRSFEPCMLRSRCQENPPKMWRIERNDSEREVAPPFANWLPLKSPDLETGRELELIFSQVLSKRPPTFNFACLHDSWRGSNWAIVGSIEGVVHKSIEAQRPRFPFTRSFLKDSLTIHSFLFLPRSWHCSWRKMAFLRPCSCNTSNLFLV